MTNNTKATVKKITGKGGRTERNDRDFSKTRVRVRKKRAQKYSSRTRSILERMSDGFVAFDTDMNYTYVNKRGGELLGRKPEDLIGKNYWKEYPEAEGTPFAKAYIRALTNQLPVQFEDYYKPWGRWFENRIYPSANDLSIFFTDITSRKQTENKLKYLTRLDATRSKINQAIVRIKDRQELFEAVCKVAVQYGQFHMAWIGLTDSLSGEVKVVAYAGEQAEAYIRQVNINFKDERSRSGPTAVAIRTNRVVLVNDVQTDLRMRPWRAAVLQQGYRSMAIVPLCVGSEVIGVLDLYATEVDFFNKDERSLLEEMGADISFALEVMDAENERRRDQKKLEIQLERLSALQAIDTAITTGLDLRYIMETFILHMIEHSGVDAVDVFTFHPKLSELRLFAGRGFYTDQSSRSQVRLGDDFASKAVRERKLIRIPDLNTVKLSKTEAELISKERFFSYFAVPLITKGEVKGVLELYHRSPLDPDLEWLRFIQTLADRSAIAIAEAELFNKLKQSNIELLSAYDETIEGWSRALDLRDKETEGHTRRVVGMALQLATIMGVREADIIHLRRGALLHDIGKMGVPDQILFKPEPLNEEEWVLMHKHPQYAFEMLAPISFLRPALDIPYCHHEKWDGTGYPRGLHGEEIPLSARIFSVVDVYDALISDRSYRKGWPPKMALDYIREHSGSHFDPQVVKAFLEMVRAD